MGNVKEQRENQGNLFLGENSHKNPIFPSDFVNHLNDDPFQRFGRVRLDHIVLQPRYGLRVSNHPVINSKGENWHEKK